MSVGSDKLRVVEAVAKAADGCAVECEDGGPIILANDEQLAEQLIDNLDRDGWQLVRK